MHHVDGRTGAIKLWLSERWALGSHQALLAFWIQLIQSISSGDTTDSTCPVLQQQCHPATLGLSDAYPQHHPFNVCLPERQTRSMDKQKCKCVCVWVVFIYCIYVLLKAGFSQFIVTTLILLCCFARPLVPQSSLDSCLFGESGKEFLYYGYSASENTPRPRCQPLFQRTVQQCMYIISLNCKHNNCILQCMCSCGAGDTLFIQYCLAAASTFSQFSKVQGRDRMPGVNATLEHG